MRRIGYLLCACHVCMICAQQQKAEQVESGQSWQGTVSEQMPTSQRGNWYVKLQYDRQGRDVYEYISKKGKEAEQMSNQFAQKQKEIHDHIWRMYQDYGLDSPEVTKNIRDVIQKLKQEQAEQDLSEQEREWLTRAREHKASIEEIDEHITSLVKLHKAVDDAIALFDEQVDQIDTYEDAAWNTYEEIVQTPNHEVAQQKYHELLTIRDNVDNIIAYGKTQFAQFLQQLASQIDTYISRLQSAMKKLDEAGVRLQKRIAQADQEEPGEEQPQQQQQEPQESQPQQESEEAAASIWDTIVYPFTLIGGYVRDAVYAVLQYVGIGDSQ